MAPVSGSRIGAAEQLHGVTGRTRCSAPKICTGRPRASAVPGAFVPADVLAPVGTGQEVHVLGAGCAAPGPLHPQQLPGGVADRDQQAGLGGAVDQQAPDDRHGRGQRVGGADLGQLGRVEPDLGQGALRIETAADTAPPRIDDDPAQRAVDLAGLDEVVVHLMEIARQGRCVGARRHRQAVAQDHGPTIASGRAAPGWHDRMTA